MKKRLPALSIAVLSLIIAGSIFAGAISPKDPSYLNLSSASLPPDGKFLFGTDTLGRDIFSMIWYGGRISLFIGILAALVSSVIAFVYGAASGLAPDVADNAMMRLAEIFLSIPSILIVVFLQAVIGAANAVSISLVIGATNWMGIAKIVRSEVRQIRKSDFVCAARCMGAGFFHVLTRHMIPNFIPPVMFMAVMNIAGAIATEATLSFLGLGLAPETVSWGSMLSLAQNALLTNAWWVIVIPGVFLCATMICIANIANYFKLRNDPRQSNI